MIAISDGNNKVLEIVKFAKNSDKLDFDKEVTNSINKSTSNLVFYDRCVVNITLSFENTKTGDRKTLRDVRGLLNRKRLSFLLHRRMAF